MMLLKQRIIIFLFGKYVGSDDLGNHYYEEKKPKKGFRPRRWVIYKGHQEASKTPALWFGWIHHIMEELPLGENNFHYPWLKRHAFNMTGTKAAYYPKPLEKLKTTYKAWVPPKK